NETIKSINDFERNGVESSVDDINLENYDEDEDIEELLENNASIGGKVKINLKDMNTIGWKQDLVNDQQILTNLSNEFSKIKPENDLKLIELINTIRKKIDNPINENNKKVIIFS